MRRFSLQSNNHFRFIKNDMEHSQWSDFSENDTLTYINRRTKSYHIIRTRFFIIYIFPSFFHFHFDFYLFFYIYFESSSAIHLWLWFAIQRDNKWQIRAKWFRWKINNNKNITTKSMTKLNVIPICRCADWSNRLMPFYILHTYIKISGYIILFYCIQVRWSTVDQET